MKYSTNCKNQKVVDGYIKNYQTYTKDTVENILKLSSLIVEMKDKEKSGELDESDMKYFCFSVGLTREGSTFRKFERIGSCVDKFRTYIDKLPDSYTTLYEITTLDDELFERLMENDEIHSYVTLKDIKRLGNKVTNNKKFKKYSSFKVIFNHDKLDRDDEKLLKLVIKGLNKLYEKEIVEVQVPKKDSGNKVFAGKRYDVVSGRWVEEEDLTVKQKIKDVEVIELEELMNT